MSVCSGQWGTLVNILYSFVVVFKYGKLWKVGKDRADSGLSCETLQTVKNTIKKVIGI